MNHKEPQKCIQNSKCVEENTVYYKRSYLQNFLPDEVLLKICLYAAPCDLGRLSCTCKRIREVSLDPTLWKRIYKKCYRTEYTYKKSSSTGLYEIHKVISENSCQMVAWRESFKRLASAYHVTQDEQTISNLKFYQIKHSRTLQDAVNLSSGLIFVHNGKYNESINIDRTVTILGSDFPDNLDEQTTFTHNSETVIKFTTSAAKSCIAYLKLILEKKSEQTSLRNHCIEVASNSTPIIHNCRITSKNNCAAAVYVHGTETSPKILHCKITDSNNVGLFVSDGARGVYEDNEICGNRLAGVWVKAGASPIMRRNQVHHGKDAGFFIFDGGMGYYEENDVHSNRIAGIEVRSSANPTVVNCHIHHGFTGGIYVHDDGRGEFICNRIHTNTFAGVWITSGSNPTVKDNEIYNGQQGGIYVFGDGRGLIENNNIHGNALAGIQIRSNSNPIVRKNRIHNGLHGGIYIHEGGMGLVEDNEIYANTLAGIWITTGSTPILRHNRIHSGKQVGVYFYDQGCGTLEDNEIYNHRYSGIQIRSGSNPIIRQNKIWGGRNGGILIYNGGQGILEDNEIFDNAMAGVWIKTESNPVLRRNKIHDGREGGICVFNSGKGLLEENDIFRNRLTGVLISTSSHPVLRRNRIFEGGAAGIEVTNAAGGIFERNEIFNNRFEGICLATDVTPKMIENNCHDNGNALSKAVEEGKCLYQVSGSVCYPMHDFYRCITCSAKENFAICVSCIEKCHAGHNTEFVRHDRFFCDCGAGTSPLSCKILEPDNRNLPNNRKTASNKLATSKGRSLGGSGKRKGRSALRTDGTSKELSQTLHASNEHDKQVGDVNQSNRMDCESV